MDAEHSQNHLDEILRMHRSSSEDDNSGAGEVHDGKDAAEMPQKLRFRVGKSIALYISFLTLGLSGCVVGPTMVSMQHLLQADTITISGALVGRSVGYLLGAMLCGLTFDRANKELQFTVAIFIQGAALALAPFTGHVHSYITFIAILALGGGFLDSAGSCYALVLWGGYRIKSPFMQGLHTTWSLGATLGPLIVHPFLVDLGDDVTSVAVNASSNLTGIGNTSTMEPPDVEYVRFSYVAIGSLVLVSGIGYLVLFIMGGPALNCSRKAKNEQDTKHTPPHSDRCYTAIMLCLLFVHFFVIVYIEGCTGSYVAAFVVRFLGWEISQGALIVSVFHGALGLGRLSNIGIAAILSPRTTLILNLTLTLLSYVLMCFVQYHDIIMWVSVAMAGFFQASTYPALILWASNYIKVTGFSASVFVVGSSVAGMVYPHLVGKFFDDETQMTMIYMILIVAVIQCLIFVTVQAFAICRNPKKLEDTKKVSEQLEPLRNPSET